MLTSEPVRNGFGYMSYCWVGGGEGGGADGLDGCWGVEGDARGQYLESGGGPNTLCHDWPPY